MAVGQYLAAVAEMPYAQRKLLPVARERLLLAAKASQPPQPPIRKWTRQAATTEPAKPKPRARLNAMAFKLRKQGWRTIGEVVDATGVPASTVCDWEAAGKIPPMQKVNGVRVISPVNFEDMVARVRELRRSRAKRKRWGKASRS